MAHFANLVLDADGKPCLAPWAFGPGLARMTPEEIRAAITPAAKLTPTCRWGGTACDDPGDDGLCPHHRARKAAWGLR